MEKIKLHSDQWKGLGFGLIQGISQRDSIDKRAEVRDIDIIKQLLNNKKGSRQGTWQEIGTRGD